MKKLLLQNEDLNRILKEKEAHMVLYQKQVKVLGNKNKEKNKIIKRQKEEIEQVNKTQEKMGMLEEQVIKILNENDHLKQATEQKDRMIRQLKP